MPATRIEEILPVLTNGGAKIKLSGADGEPGWDAKCGGCTAELPTELDKLDAMSSAFEHARICWARPPRP